MKTCSVDACQRPHRARGWCSKHYLQWFNNGKTGEPTERVEREHCMVEGCSTTPRSRFAEMCEAHYGRQRRTGAVAAEEPVRTFRTRVIATPCVQCGKNETTALYCSRRCQSRAFRGVDESSVRECLECGDEIGRERRVDAAFCSRECGRSARGGRGVGRRKCGPRALGRRDGWTCHICGEPVDPAVKWPHPRSATVDHVTPVSRGGSGDPSNLALAHAVCNIKKGNR